MELDNLKRKQKSMLEQETAVRGFKNPKIMRKEYVSGSREILVEDARNMVIDSKTTNIVITPPPDTLRRTVDLDEEDASNDDDSDDSELDEEEEEEQEIAEDTISSSTGGGDLEVLTEHENDGTEPRGDNSNQDSRSLGVVSGGDGQFKGREDLTQKVWVRSFFRVFVDSLLIF